MSEPQPFPQTRDELETLYLKHGAVFVTSVLLWPKGGEGRQRIRLLQGSLLRRRKEPCCSDKAERIRERLKNCGALIPAGNFLRLTCDETLDNLSIAACVATGASISGCKFWLQKGSGYSVEQLRDKSGLVYYDPDSEMPWPTAHVGQVCSIPDLSSTERKRPSLIAATKDSSIFAHHLRKGKSCCVQSEQKADVSIIRCESGKIIVKGKTRFDDSKLSPSQMEILRPSHPCEYKLVAVEDSVVTETVFNTS